MQKSASPQQFILIPGEKALDTVLSSDLPDYAKLFFLVCPGELGEPLTYFAVLTDGEAAEWQRRADTQPTALCRLVKNSVWRRLIAPDVNAMLALSNRVIRPPIPPTTTPRGSP